MSNQNTEWEDAKRVGFNPLIVLYSESGAGKTYSSLLLARGIAGPEGIVAIGDSENGRAKICAGMPDIGTFKWKAIDEPYHPQKFIDTMDYFESRGAAVGIIDSGSMEWDGVGGVTDMAAEREAETKRAGLHNWKQPKFEHAKFVQRLMRARIPWIVCLRAKFKTRQTKDGGKTVIVKDDFPSPIQAEDFIFEATCHGLILPDHSLKLTKWSHPGLKACFPTNGPIEVKHGKMIAEWCAAAGGTTTPSAPAQPDAKAIKSKLWKMTEKIHGGDANKLHQWLEREGLIGQGVELASLSPERIQQVIEESKLLLPV